MFAAALRLVADTVFLVMGIALAYIIYLAYNDAEMFSKVVCTLTTDNDVEATICHIKNHF